MTFDPCAVSLVNALCRDGDAKIVIHSSWLKHWPIQQANQLEDFGFDNTVAGWCQFQGIESRFFHEDAECDKKWGWRYDRIDDWLSRHKEVTEYCILDDEKYNDGYPRADHVILTDFDEGITMKNYRDVFRLLYPYPKADWEKELDGEADPV